eukprot:10288311-Ditylum_brightwellii.AAC.1
MSCILKGMTSYTHASPKLFHTFKKDILLSAKLLESTKNLTHGMFLGYGGSYTKRLYYHKLGEVNTKENLIKARPLSMDQGSACKLINTFLNEIDDTKADPLYTEKPKCFVTKESTKDTTGKAIVMKDNKEHTYKRLQNKVMKAALNDLGCGLVS